MGRFRGPEARVRSVGRVPPPHAVTWTLNCQVQHGCSRKDLPSTRWLGPVSLYTNTEDSESFRKTPVGFAVADSKDPERRVSHGPVRRFAVEFAFRASRLQPGTLFVQSHGTLKRSISHFHAVHNSVRSSLQE